MDLPDILGEEDSSSTEQRSRSLYFLGRRLERLFLGGVLLVVLSFLSVLLTTASKQLTNDKALAGVTALEESIAKDKDHLTELFQHRNDPPPRSVAPETPERLKALSATRKQLGLPDPPPIPAQPSLPEPKEKYTDVISKLVLDCIKQSKVTDSDLISKLLDFNSSPEELQKTLAVRREALENKPTSFWGIETPRTLRLRYADQSYTASYDVISILIMIPLAFLILGWLTAVYMTRQRELITIAELRDYKQAFPHILNFLPVDFARVFPIKRKIPKRSHKQNQVALCIVRAFVILLFSVPMVLGFVYSLLTLLDRSGDTPSLFWFLLGTIVVGAMLVQILALVAQEGFLLSGKLFVE
jgi:hypothetical protein